MTRAFLQFAPALLPFLLYGLLVVAARYATAPGLDWAVRVMRADQSLRAAPWGWLIGSAIAIALVCALAAALSGGDPPGGTYVPAHMQDGRLVPGDVSRP